MKLIINYVHFYFEYQHLSTFFFIKSNNFLQIECKNIDFKFKNLLIRKLFVKLIILRFKFGKLVQEYHIGVYLQFNQ